MATTMAARTTTSHRGNARGGECHDMRRMSIRERGDRIAAWRHLIPLRHEPPAGNGLAIAGMSLGILRARAVLDPVRRRGGRVARDRARREMTTRVVPTPRLEDTGKATDIGMLERELQDPGGASNAALLCRPRCVPGRVFVRRTDRTTMPRGSGCRNDSIYVERCRARLGVVSRGLLHDLQVLRSRHRRRHELRGA